MDSLEKGDIGVVGVGPYFHFTHLPFLVEMEIFPKIIVELESRRSGIEVLVMALGLENVELVFVPDEQRDDRELSREVKNQLSGAISKHQVTKFILSTEPKSHYSYLDFFLNNGIDVFCEKPLTVTSGATINPVEAEQIWSDYLQLLSLSHKTGAKLYLNIKRRVSKVYKYVQSFLAEFADRYELGPTSIEISASDGMWNMPSEILSRENHPYKYGYGKLFHTGFHFVDLLSELARAPRARIGHEVKNLYVAGTAHYPDDHLDQMGEGFYRQVFSSSEDLEPLRDKAKNLGELDVFSTVRFGFDKGGALLTSLNLLSTSFSRRYRNQLPIDTYRANGRVRHERWNIHIGPLANIQFQQYGSLQQPGDDVAHPYPVTEILVFKNTHLTGGKVFEKIEDFSTLEGAVPGDEEYVLMQEFLDNKPSSISDETLRLSIFTLMCLAKHLATERQKSRSVYEYPSL